MRNAAILIPVHNRRATTLACLRRLQENGDIERFDVIIIDDGSTDGTREAVQDAFPTISILSGNGDLWWTGAIALGMSHAFERGADLVFWLNDDCLPRAGALESVARFIATERESIVAPVCIDPTTNTRIASGFKGRTDLPAPARGEIVMAHGLSGYCLAVPRSVWERIGTPDADRFPHYYGDTSYTVQAHAAGFPIVILGDAEVELADFQGRIRSPGQYRNPARSWTKEYTRTFLNKKSPFRLATQWHMLRLKYGVALGSMLAVQRFAAWSLRFAFGK